MSDDPDDLNIEALLARLAPAQMAERRPIDRYRDFRRVFLSTDEGRRVLDDILWLAHVNRPLSGRDNPYVLNSSEGQRVLALKIAAIAHIEPPAEPVGRKSADDGVAANRQWIKE